MFWQGCGWRLGLASCTYQGGWAPGTRGPHQPSAGAGRSVTSSPGCSVSEILALSSRSFFCNITHHALRLAHPISDYFCYSMGVIISLFSLVSILRTCVYIFICFRIICIQYGGGSFLALVLRTKFFFKWIPREVLQDSGGCCWFRALSVTNISWICSLSLTSLCSLSEYSSRLWTFFNGRDLTIGRTL